MHKHFGGKQIAGANPDLIDLCLGIGGDGTILHFFQTYPAINAPYLGINLGHLGYLTDILLTELNESLELIAAKKYTLEKRLLLEYTQGGKVHYALNDLTIHRGKNPHLVELKINVDGLYLNTFRADGVIFATPTGSTAYSLSAGGPILSSNLDAIVLTPISSHTISNRPFVFLPHESIHVEYISKFEPIELAIDGFFIHELQYKEKIKITLSKRKFTMASLGKRDAFSILRKKLNWSGKLVL